MCFLQSSESVCMRGSERNEYIFRLASMRWDSTLQGLAASQTPLLPRKHAAACHWRGATQFNHVWLSVAHTTEVEYYTALQHIGTTQRYSQYRRTLFRRLGLDITPWRVKVISIQRVKNLSLGEVSEFEEEAAQSHSFYFPLFSCFNPILCSRLTGWSWGH